MLKNIVILFYFLYINIQLNLLQAYFYLLKKAKFTNKVNARFSKTLVKGRFKKSNLGLSY